MTNLKTKQVVIAWLINTASSRLLQDAFNLADLNLPNTTKNESIPLSLLTSFDMPQFSNFSQSNSSNDNSLNSTLL